MSRYGDRDYERGQQDYGRRSDSDYDRSYGDQSQWSGRDESERERYSGESRWRGQYGGGESDRLFGGGEASRQLGGGDSGRYYSGAESRPQMGGEYGNQYGGFQGRTGRGYRSGRERYENDPDYLSDRDSRYGSHERDYGSSGSERNYGTSRNYSQRYNYPSGFRSGESYGRGRSEYDRGDYDSGQERGWWDRASDEVASWFGDEEAERRRRMDEQRQMYRGRGPKGYRRSDERIKEDVNDRLSEGYLDASDIEVEVQNSEVTLTGTVNNRNDKRRAEDIAESVSGVTNVENRIRVKHEQYGQIGSTGVTGTTGTTGTSGTTGTTGTSTSSAAAGGTGTTARGRTAGT
jgi:osmotically-inducible protein OsmY